MVRYVLIFTLLLPTIGTSAETTLEEDLLQCERNARPPTRLANERYEFSNIEESAEQVTRRNEEQGKGDVRRMA